MTPDALTGMIAVGKDSKIKPLGFVVWFSVPDRPVSLLKLRRAWLSTGLPMECLPADPRELYLFKRAMREQQGKVRTNGHVVETDVRPVAENADECAYQISQVVKDEEERLVNYPKAMRVTYQKATGNLDFHKLGEVPRRDLVPMELAITEYIERNAKRVDGRKVRTVVRKFLKDDADEQRGVAGLSGENLRGKGGGVYFVQAKHQDDLEAVAEALANLHNDESAYLYSVPLADGASERELIRRHHKANAIKEIDEAIEDVRKILREDRKNAVRSDVKDYWFAKLRALQRRAAEYRGLLKEEVGDVDDKIDAMKLQIEGLV